MRNRIMSLLAAVLMLFSLSLRASADQPVPDLTQNGNLTFVMELDGVPLDGGALNLYQVGNIREYDGNYSFQLTEAFQSRELLPDEVCDPILAQELLTLAMPLNLTKISAPITKGKAEFTNLPVGLYLVWQTDADATEGYMAIQPFLISVPRFQDGEYLLDYVANPKVPLESAPTEPTEPSTTAPEDDYLPETGQLNWPIPMMALSGAVLFITGVILCVGRKRTGNEE